MAVLFAQKIADFFKSTFWVRYLRQSCDNLATWLATIDCRIAIIGPLFLWALGYQRAFKALLA